MALPPAQVLAVHIHVHHHLHGPPLGYLGVALAALASWAGVPGPGETVLVAGGIFAAKGRLDLAELLVVAWMGAMVGGMVGWAVGRHAGQRLVTAPGPFLRQRAVAMERGERFFARWGVLAVYFAPSWVAGSVGLRASRFIPANAICAVLWVALVGVGAYVVGPPIVDVVGDIGLIGLLVLAVVAVAGVAVAGLRRVRSRR